MHCLIIGKVWPEPSSTAAGRRTLDIIRSLRSEGFAVTFTSSAQRTSHSSDLKALGVSVYSFQPNDSAFDTWLADLAPDLVLFDRFMVEEQFGWRVKKACPNALRVLDTSDLHCLREARQTKLHGGGTLDIYNEIALREVAAIHRSDLTLMIADYEIDLLIETFGVPSNQLAYLPFWLDPEATRFASFESRRHLIFIGSFLHPPNVDALGWCKHAIWPLIRERLPKVELHFYGAYGDRYQTELNNPEAGFIYKGRAEDALATMQQYRVNCAPLRYGAGLKGKIFDGFQTGTPTVTTPIGAEGIADAMEWGCEISSDPIRFCEAAIELYTNEKHWKNVQLCGQQIAKGRFNSKIWARALPNLIETASANMAANRKRNFIGRMLRHHHHRSTEYMSRWIESKNQSSPSG